MLNFEQEGHRYTWKGQPVPSVTAVLREWVKTPAGYIHTVSGAMVETERFETAGAFGTAIHEGAALILCNDLDWDSLDPALVPPLREFERWMDDYKVQPLHIEEPMYSEKHGVAGTPDILGELQGFRHLSLIDIKSGRVNATVGPQTGGYEIIFREQHKYRKPILRHELILPRDGSPYKFKSLNNNLDGAFFLSRLFQYNFLNA